MAHAGPLRPAFRVYHGGRNTAAGVPALRNGNADGNDSRRACDAPGQGGASQEEDHEGLGGVSSNGYDKTKSFFDNISCEAQTDRKGKPRVDWRQERKLNSETFGVSSTRRGGMGYRGRGGHNNYNNAGGYFHRGNHHQGGNGGYRNNNNNGGGNNGGYRNNNYRRNNNMRMNGTNPASTGIPTPGPTKQPVAGPSTSGGAQQTTAQVVAGENKMG